MKNANTFSTAANREVFYNPSDYVNAYVLVANTPVTVTVPPGANLASFSPAVPFWANFNGGTAAVPAVSVTNGTASTYCPTTRYIDSMPSFSIISASAGTVVVEFYAF